MVNMKAIVANAKGLEDKEQKATFVYVTADPDGDCSKVFEIEEPKDVETRIEWTRLMAEAFAEYYRDYRRYDNAKEDIGPLELVLDAVKKNNIPLIRYWDTTGVTQLNVRWLRTQYGIKGE